MLGMTQPKLLHINGSFNKIKQLRFLQWSVGVSLLITENNTFKRLWYIVRRAYQKDEFILFLRSCNFTKIYFNTHLDSSIKKEMFTIELENAIICRVFSSRSSINIALNTTSSYRKKENLISVFYISHQNFLLKHAEHYNHCISTLLGWIRNRSLSFYRI